MSAGTADGDWRDLSGSEVRQRLEHRGMPASNAAALWQVHERGGQVATDAITRALER